MSTPATTTSRLVVVTWLVVDDEAAEQREPLVGGDAVEDPLDAERPRRPRPTEPTRPWTTPSSMNGTRMNQLVAPTSFITSISRRRANIAMRIELRMSRRGGEQEHGGDDEQADADQVGEVLDASGSSRRRRRPRGRRAGPRTWSRRPSMVSADLSTGTTRKLGGRMSGVTESTICGRVLEEVLELLEGLVLVEVRRSARPGSSRRAGAATASVWSCDASGCMKTMNSMPPSHCWVALSTRRAEQERAADQRQRHGDGEDRREGEREVAERGWCRSRGRRSRA